VVALAQWFADLGLWVWLMQGMKPDASLLVEGGTMHQSALCHNNAPVAEAAWMPVLLPMRKASASHGTQLPGLLNELLASSQCGSRQLSLH
jgi:hypothetical protein